MHEHTIKLKGTTMKTREFTDCNGIEYVSKPAPHRPRSDQPFCDDYCEGCAFDYTHVENSNACIMADPCDMAKNEFNSIIWEKKNG